MYRESSIGSSDAISSTISRRKADLVVYPKSMYKSVASSTNFSGKHMLHLFIAYKYNIFTPNAHKN